MKEEAFEIESAVTNMNDLWLTWAIKIQSIAQAGLAYCKDTYDRERYEQLRLIAAEMLAKRTGLPTQQIQNVFCMEKGYQTPKIDTRAAIFQNEKILLVHENNGTWALPGGWCDVDQSIASNTVKEVKEETGLDVIADKLIAVQDWRKHNVQNYAFGVIKTFLLCKKTGGSFYENTETTGFAYFGPQEIPKPLATEKNSLEQILMCFEANHKNIWDVRFD